MNIEVIKNTVGEKNYNKAFDSIIDRFTESAGIHIEGEALKNAKRQEIKDTGRLIGSITYQTHNGGSRVGAPAAADDKISEPNTEYSVDIGSAVEYAPYHEYGTVKMMARPFLRPALRRSRKAVTKLFEKLIREGLQRGK